MIFFIGLANDFRYPDICSAANDTIFAGVFLAFVPFEHIKKLARCDRSAFLVKTMFAGATL